MKNTGRDKMVLAGAQSWAGDSLLVQCIQCIRRMRRLCRSRMRLFKMWWNQSRRSPELLF